MSATRRRWPRAVAPFAVVLVLVLITVIAHLVEEPDLSDPGTLSPTGTGPDGSSRLAELLTRQGVRIERVTSTEEAVAAAWTGRAAIFVPTPDYPVPSLIGRIAELPGTHRVVAVRPGLVTQLSWGVPVLGLSDRWAATAAAPGCDNALATTARRATLWRSAYISDPEATVANCFHGGLVGVRFGGSEVYVAGASDPFRNSRLDEHDNAALATTLLGGLDRVIWVDVHRAEPRPKSGLLLPRYSRDDLDRGSDNTLWTAFPAPLWAILAMLLIAGVLIALARARRLGPPVPEPLPVVVPAAETVTGRGRLYQRIRARDATLTALRGAAVARLGRLVDPLAPPSRDELIQRLAARTGISVDAVRTILTGPPPGTDEELIRAVADLDQLMRAASRDNPGAGQPADTVHRGGTP